MIDHGAAPFPTLGNPVKWLSLSRQLVRVLDQRSFTFANICLYPLREKYRAACLDHAVLGSEQGKELFFFFFNAWEVGGHQLL